MTTPNEDLILKLRGQAYTTCRPDQLCDQAADLLQSQAERIAGLEKLERALKEGLALACIERDTLRAQLADAELHTKQVERGLDKATAQLAEIEKTEPVSLATDQTDEFGEVIYREVFTHPMPAQDVTELVEALSALVDCITETRGTRPDADLVKAQAHAVLFKYKGSK